MTAITMFLLILAALLGIAVCVLLTIVFMLSDLMRGAAMVASTFIDRAK